MFPRLGLLAAVLLGPAVALGQLTITESNNQDRIINIDECTPGGVSDGLTFQWTISGFTQVGTYEVWASDTSGCLLPSTTSGTTAVTRSQGTVTATSASGAFPDTGSINVKTLLTNLSITCQSSTQNIFFCIDYIAGTGTQKAIVQSPLRLDLLRPAIPAIVSAQAAESGLVVTWREGTSAGVDAGSPGSSTSYRVFARPAEGGDEKSQDITVTGSGDLSGRITGLVNGTTYDVQVAALSPGSNLSERSDTVRGTPAPVNDLWRSYQNDGGREQGGCAAGAAGLAALATLLPLAFRRSRRRRP